MGLITSSLSFLTWKIHDGIFIAQESKLKAARMHLYVRRGGPNYQRGLAKMRALAEEIGLPIEVYLT